MVFPPERSRSIRASASGFVNMAAGYQASALLAASQHRNSVLSRAVPFLEAHAARKRPAVPGPIDANVRGSRFHPKGVQQPVVIVWIPVACMDRHVELVGTLHEVQAVDGEDHLGIASQALRIHLLDERVRAV